MHSALIERLQSGVGQSGTTSSQQSKLETRTYKGAVYEKGADGQWYLQKK